MNRLRVRDSAVTVSTVWRRAFTDALFAPRRFRRLMPEFRRLSDMLFHPGIGDFDVAKLPARESAIQMFVTSAEYGGMPSQDLYALLRVMRWLQPRRIFEIGTFQGVTTAHMAANCKAEIFTLDLSRDLAADVTAYTHSDLQLLQQQDEIGKAYRPFNAEGRIHQLFGDSRTFDYSAYMGSMDLVLIDACHVFDYVIRDTGNALRLLADHGAILWHDFGNSRDVVRALQTVAKTTPIVHLEGTALALYLAGIDLSARTLAPAAGSAAQEVA
jgi:predicted O-methyltransferase YrrM